MVLPGLKKKKEPFLSFQVWLKENFRCYNCAFKTNCVNQIIEQMTILHENETLRYRELSLDEVPGKFREVTKTKHNVTTHRLKGRGKLLTVKLAF